MEAGMIALYVTLGGLLIEVSIGIAAAVAILTEPDEEEEE